MAADNRAVDVGRRCRIACSLQSLGQEITETAAVEHAALTENAVARQFGIFECQERHSVHRVGDDDEDSVRRILQRLVNNTFDDFCIYADEFFTRHARFTRHTGSNNNYIGAFRRCITVFVTDFSRNARYRGVKVQQMCCLHDIHSFAFCKTFLNIHEHNFAAEILYCQHICYGSAYVTCTNNCYLHNQMPP